jgi:VIT1/CCC1 family predicted Fe2+/Mn2+ transporter
MPPRAAYRTKQRPSQQEGFLGRLLDPIDRLAETIFSVLILLTFTLAYRIIRLGPSPNEPIPPDYMVDLFVAALGATVAWGMIDGEIYALLSVLERGEKHQFLASVQAAATQEEGIHAIAEELDFVLEPITGAEQRRLLYLDVLDHLHDSRPMPVTLTRDDILGGLGSTLVAVLAVLPSLAPLLLLRDHDWLALRASNIVSFVVLFYTGYQWGKYSGSNPWKMGLLLFVIGAVLAFIAIPLGG